ncbi:MAG: hypothetical protein AB7O37_04110 [Vicinamibacteria bacterium]
MRKPGRSALLAAILAACLAYGPGGGLARAAGDALPQQDNDLAAVKRAVAQEPGAPATTPAPRAERAQPRRGPADQGRWLRVRVNERGGRKRVSINLPLAFVRAFDDVPIQYDCGHESRRRCTLRLAEILSALDQGEDLVQIDDEETKVRVWIE